MNLKVEYIKKIMGWCPNSNTLKTQHSIHPEYVEANSQSRGNDAENSETLSWFRKLSNRYILLNAFFTFVYILIINYSGVNLVVLLAGCSISMLIFVLFWRKQMQIYDTIAQRLFLDYSDKKNPYRILVQTIQIIYYVLFFYWIFYMNKDYYFMQTIVSFSLGPLILMWFSYFQLIYWEKIHHSTIYLNKRYGKWKTSYIIKERK